MAVDLMKEVKKYGVTYEEYKEVGGQAEVGKGKEAKVRAD
jgi:hypothetical protein